MVAQQKKNNKHIEKTQASGKSNDIIPRANAAIMKKEEKNSEVLQADEGQQKKQKPIKRGRTKKYIERVPK